MADSTLYDDDIVAWAEQQAEALRRLAASPMAANTVDWDNVIEEIESVGRSEWKSVESNLTNAFIRILKGYCDSDSLSMRQWENECANFLRQVRKFFTPSMRAKIDLDHLWQEAGTAAAQELTLYGVRMPPKLPGRCPYTLNELLDETFSYQAACRLLHGLADGRH